MRLLAVLMIALLVAAPALAQKRTKKRGAKDSTPPVIEHEPIARHDGVGPVIIEARITDAQGTVFEPALLVRAKGAGAFTRIPLTSASDRPAFYSAAVPNELLSGDVEYVLEAFDEDGNGPARAGDESAPLVIAKDAPLQEAATEQNTTTPKTAPAPPEEEGVSPALIATGIVVGTLVVLGAAAGTGFAFYALREPAPQSVRVSVTGPAPIGAAP